jgi:hypothetical protein
MFATAVAQLAVPRPVAQDRAEESRRLPIGNRDRCGLTVRPDFNGGVGVPGGQRLSAGQRDPGIVGVGVPVHRTAQVLGGQPGPVDHRLQVLAPAGGDVPPAVPALTVGFDHRGVGQQGTVDVARRAAEPTQRAEPPEVGDRR